MTDAATQRRYRARDPKTLVQIRLTPEQVAEIDALVAQLGLRGRADAVADLLQQSRNAQAGHVALNRIPAATLPKLIGDLASRFFRETRRRNLVFIGEAAGRCDTVILVESRHPGATVTGWR